MTRDSTMRPSGRRRYVMGAHGASEQGGRQGNYLCRSPRVETWGPSYAEGGTTIRIFPARNPENPAVWDPYRFSPEKNQFGDWIRRYPAVRAMGDPSVTFITHDPSNETASPDAEEMTPGWLLWRAIDRAVASGQDQPGWAAILRGGRNRGAILPRPTEVYLVQACVLQNKMKTYSPPKGFNPDEKTIVFELGRSAGLALLNELNKVKEGYQGPDDDYENMMVNGDPIALNHGRFVHFYCLAQGDPRDRAAQATTAWNAPSTRDAGREREQIGYGCVLDPMFQGRLSADLHMFEQAIAAKVVPWDEIIYLPTPDEQAQLLADKLPPEVILYAWRDHPEWIPETVRRRAAASTQVAMAGHGGPVGSQPLTPPGPPAQPGWGVPGQANPAFSPPTQPPQGAPAYSMGGAAIAGDGRPMSVPTSASPAAMGWGTAPNPTAPPVSRGLVDPALPQGSMPAGVPAGASVVPPGVSAASTGPANAPEASPSQEQPQAAPAGVGQTRAQAALARAMAAAGRR